jgi:hypothetical protein
MHPHHAVHSSQQPLSSESAAAEQPLSVPHLLHVSAAAVLLPPQFQAEAKQVQAEAQAALRAMWQASQSLPA